MKHWIDKLRESIPEVRDMDYSVLGSNQVSISFTLTSGARHSFTASDAEHRRIYVREDWDFLREKIEEALKPYSNEDAQFPPPPVWDGNNVMPVSKLWEAVYTVPENPAVLTDAEREVLSKLAEAYDLFRDLPVQHPMHADEFCHAVHAAQRLVMSRPVARVEGWVHSKGVVTRLTVLDSSGDMSVQPVTVGTNDGEPK